MEITSYTPGTPSWIDLGTTDVAGGTAFYSTLFGWDVEDMGPDAGGYAMAKLNGKFVAGLGPAQRDDIPPYWTTYISVANADDTAARVANAGGQTIVEPFDVFDSGRMAVFADPAGAVFSIWEAKEHIGAQLVNEPGTLTWNELMTRDPATAKRFYTEVFGWEITDMDWDGMIYGMVNLPAKPGEDKSVAGIFEMGSDIPAEVPPNWSVYFNVSNTDDTVAKAQELGASVLVPATDIMPGRFAVIKDPQGAMFSVLQFAQR